jgi:hyperosmotically inducible protein
MTASVKLRLFTAAQVPSAEISVDTDDGVVTLFGMVPTADVKKSAAEEAGKVSGVTRVLNQLEVVATSHKKAVEAKDSDISRDLALAFKDRPEFRKVETAVKNGTVRLTGTVASGWDEVNVARLVRQIAGVKGVEDQLKIDEATETTRRD